MSIEKVAHMQNSASDDAERCEFRGQNTERWKSSRKVLCFSAGLLLVGGAAGWICHRYSFAGGTMGAVSQPGLAPGPEFEPWRYSVWTTDDCTGDAETSTSGFKVPSDCEGLFVSGSSVRLSGNWADRRLCVYHDFGCVGTSEIVAGPWPCKPLTGDAVSVKVVAANNGCNAG